MVALPSQSWSAQVTLFVRAAPPRGTWVGKLLGLYRLRTDTSTTSAPPAVGAGRGQRGGPWQAVVVRVGVVLLRAGSAASVVGASGVVFVPDEVCVCVFVFVVGGGGACVRPVVSGGEVVGQLVVLRRWSKAWPPLKRLVLVLAVSPSGAKCGAPECAANTERTSLAPPVCLCSRCLPLTLLLCCT